MKTISESMQGYYCNSAGHFFSATAKGGPVGFVLKNLRFSPGIVEPKTVNKGHHKKPMSL